MGPPLQPHQDRGQDQLPRHEGGGVCQLPGLQRTQPPVRDAVQRCLWREGSESTILCTYKGETMFVSGLYSVNPLNN